MIEPLDPGTLPARCRISDARQMVYEAIGCLHSGAFRASIESIWIAVVYDLFGKLRELALSGDAKAREYISKIDEAVNKHDIRASQEIEAYIQGVARDDFDLITAIEYDDLNRLHEDRHRCAHPSLNQPEDMYSPPPEYPGRFICLISYPFPSA